MNVRDPFNLHRSRTPSVFRIAAASQSKPRIRRDETATTTPPASSPDDVPVANALDDMSFSVPRNVPSFSNPQRQVEDHIWRAAGMSSRAGGLFDNKGSSLPMYKDKPYAYPASGRVRPLWRRKRTILLVTVVLGLLWWFGVFSKEEGGLRQQRPKWAWLSSPDKAAKSKADWLDRRERVVEAFQLSWDAYERYAWGYDEYHPVAKTGRQMAKKGLGWIIIDALDTMILMNQTSRLHHARQWISESLTWDQDQDVNTFETTIRMLGGLLSAHYLTTEFPSMAPLSEDDPGTPGEDLFLEKAKDLADRLITAFDSPTGIPWASVNLGQFSGIPSHDDQGASSTAETTTLQLEFKYLAKLTGEKYFWDKVEKVMQIIDDLNPPGGLVPIYLYPTSGEFRGSNIRLGSRGDSYYEYLIKQYLQTNKAERVYKEMWQEALDGVRKHLVTYTRKSGFTIIAEAPDGLDKPLSPKMDHLVCFMPGTIALAATEGLTEAEARKLPTWTKKRNAEMKLARELMTTCWGMYKYMATGLAAEITYFDMPTPHEPESPSHVSAPDDFDPDPHAAWRHDFNVQPADRHNLQRPETVESLFYLWRITGEEKYREWGWEMFKSFINYTAVPEGGGFTSLSNANEIPPIVKDNMESFWLAETLKYFYLLFSPDDLLPLDKVVFNTEAHPLPRFDMGKLFTTGWKRKQRDLQGRIIKQAT